MVNVMVDTALLLEGLEYLCLAVQLGVAEKLWIITIVLNRQYDRAQSIQYQIFIHWLDIMRDLQYNRVLLNQMPPLNKKSNFKNH